MPKKRASIFGDVVDLDLKGFAPKNRVDTKAPSREQVQAVAEAANFPSRQASAQTPKSAKNVLRGFIGPGATFSSVQKPPRRRWTRSTPSQMPILVGFSATPERAVEALQRELEVEKTS